MPTLHIAGPDLWLVLETMQQVGAESGVSQLSTAHMLLALIECEALAARCARDHGLHPEAWKSALNYLANRPVNGRLEYGRVLKAALQMAIERAEEADSRHLLWAACEHSPAIAALLEQYGLETSAAAAWIELDLTA